jgi:hypothetical protein
MSQPWKKRESFVNFWFLVEWMTLKGVFGVIFFIEKYN